MTKLKFCLAAALAMLVLFGCDDQTAQGAVENNGFTAVQLEGWDVFACGRDDWYARAFTATNANGRRVHGVVCCGLMKKCTIRF